MDLLSIYYSNRSECKYNNQVDSDQIKFVSNDVAQCNVKSEKFENSKLLNLL